MYAEATSIVFSFHECGAEMERKGGKSGTAVHEAKSLIGNVTPALRDHEPDLRLSAAPVARHDNPRVFVIRHGETEWSLNGRHTGSTDIPLTANGERRVRATGRALVGSDRLIVPKRISHMRAQRTFELLNLGISDDLPWKCHGDIDGDGPYCNAHVEVTEDIREWDYGNYEGITSPEIRRIRKEQGLGENWDIWRDGCPGGESPQDVTDRLDRLIKDIRERWHKPVIGNKDAPNGDVLIVAHGHILRAFAMRWAGKTLQDGPAFLLEAGGVGTLSIEEPAILLGGAFAVDIIEKEQQAKEAQEAQQAQK
ncbi:sedoheptulose-1,7-bisphosphatase, chloroplastic [Colletotrichum spaethianum]|uniref:Sedoheptulose-1,7-bisphosphatase, chloroplastic n=1 Tax=Colletotrichum spaethianum TaxID=700344 RepID=A0AA37P0W0_9PEZI|nr:sedoheptulose-1,7-bisphosphatase, chloroplastic [Colletotrichum spaethianum]GKT46070.1 sedoheptulose-1,7-bisphosphatase, chloroplastic [Colletotrichum spaethianum]